VANIKSHPNNLKLLGMTTYIVRVFSRAPFLSFLISTHFLFSLTPFIFFSRRLSPQKHTCCANFKSGYTGAITIPRARHVTKNRNAVCIIELRVGHLYL